MQRASTRQLLIAACVATSGCATGLPPNPSGADVRGERPAKGLPAVARIVANERPIELAGFWNDPKEREEFNKRREELIAQRTSVNPVEVGGLGLELCARLALLCPLMLPVIIPTTIIVGAVSAHSGAAKGVPTIPISQGNATRLATQFMEGLSGVTLSERTLRRIQSAPASLATGKDFPRLVISMKSATVRADVDDELRVTIAAHVQAFASAGVEWAPTVHEVDLEFWPRYDYAVAVQKVLDVLAESIVSTYLPEHPYSVEKRYWEGVSNISVGQVQTYLDRYPDGAFAEPARAQIAKLAAEEVAARKLAAEKAAAMRGAAEKAAAMRGAAEKAAAERSPDASALQTLYRAKALLRPELEGRWAGVTNSVPCGKGSYKIVIDNGYVEGTVEWQGSAGSTLQVSGYVNAEGVVKFATSSPSRIGWSAESSLVRQAGHLVGNRIESCGRDDKTFISLSRR